jgi:hypothetical protein
MTYAEAVALKPQLQTAIATVLKNQSYTIAETTYTFANLSQLRNMLRECETIIARDGRGGMRVRRVVPRSD